VKITALIPDKLIKELHGFAKGRNLTESLVKAPSEWNQQQKIKDLNRSVRVRPLAFANGYSASRVRVVNRKS
jgi:hypothetical protein